MEGNVLEVRNVDRAIDFYTEVVGMHLLDKCDYPENRCTVAYLEPHDKRCGAGLTLTGSWESQGKEARSKLQITLIVDDVSRAKNACKYRSAEVLRVVEDNLLDLMVVVKDPDGYSVNLIAG